MPLAPPEADARPDETDTRRATKFGTPCARAWDAKWVRLVERRETDVGRRICGARTVGGVPCLLPSDHDSGRCRHHGGFPLTGAPEENRNAVVHGLYSRRLMVCGTHCPAWHSCPMGGGACEPSRRDASATMSGMGGPRRLPRPREAALKVEAASRRFVHTCSPVPRRRAALNNMPGRAFQTRMGGPPMLRTSAPSLNPS